MTQPNPVVEAVRKLITENKEKTKKIESLEKKTKDLEKRLDKLEKLVDYSTKLIKRQQVKLRLANQANDRLENEISEIRSRMKRV